VVHHISIGTPLHTTISSSHILQTSFILLLHVIVAFVAIVCHPRHPHQCFGFSKHFATCFPAACRLRMT
jgi:hypothetical protein